MYASIISWLIKMENDLSSELENSALLQAKIQLLIEGLLFAYQLRHLIATFLSLHYELERPISKQHVLSVFRLVELLKAIQHTFHRRSLFVAEAIDQCTQGLSSVCVKLLTAACQQHASRGAPSARELDVQSSLELTRRCLAGPSTRLRNITAEIAMHVAFGSKVLVYFDSQCPT